LASPIASKKPCSNLGLVLRRRAGVALKIPMAAGVTRLQASHLIKQHAGAAVNAAHAARQRHFPGGVVGACRFEIIIEAFAIDRGAIGNREQRFADPPREHIEIDPQPGRDAFAALGQELAEIAHVALDPGTQQRHFVLGELFEFGFECHRFVEFVLEALPGELAAVILETGENTLVGFTETGTRLGS